MQRESKWRNNRKVKHVIINTMSNDNLTIDTGYQYRVHVQGYEDVEIDMSIQYN
jgi:hypothetical protein